MQRSPFADDILILAAHGTTQNDGAATAAWQHAATLRQRHLFAAVHVGFWKQEPGLLAAVAAAQSPRVFIVPLFLSEGYFAERALPQALGLRDELEAAWSRLRVEPTRTLHYARPVGTHPRMTEVILARAREVVAGHPFPAAPPPREVTLFVAGHGTDRDPNSRRSVEAHAESIRARQLYANVHAVFMEENPRIADCHALATTCPVVVVPFFMSDGLHVVEDIPVLLGESAAAVRQRLAAGRPTWRNPSERRGHRIWYARAVGTDPGLADVILERVREAAQDGTGSPP